MPFSKKQERSAKRKFGLVPQRVFLGHLAQTANVSASARQAGFSTKPVYDLRQKSAEFCTRYLVALREGYVRLEANLLAEALAPPAPNIKDSTFKQKQMKVRLGLALLAAHRATVRGVMATTQHSRSRDPQEVKKRLEARFATMRQRLNHEYAPTVQ